MIDCSQFNPTKRKFHGSFPASLSGTIRADRGANDRRAQELLLTLRDGIKLASMGGGGVAGGFPSRGLRWASRFDPTKISGFVADLDFSDIGATTTIAASINDGSAFDTASWTKTDTTVIADDTAAPDSTTSADRITVSSTTNPLVSQAITNVSISGTKVPLIFTFYAKRNDVNWLCFETRSNLAANRVWFDIQNGASGTIGSTLSTPTITNAGNGWWKITFIAISHGGSPIFRIRPVDADNSVVSSAVGTYFWLWGAAVDEVRCSAVINKASAVAWSNGTANSQPGFGLINGLRALAGFAAQQIISSESAVASALTGTDPPYALFYVCTLPLDGVNRGVFGVGNSGVASNQTQVWGQGVSGTSRHRTNRIDDAAGSNTAIATAAASAGAHVVEWYRATATTVSCQVDGAAPDPNGVTTNNAGATTINQAGVLVRPDSTPDTFHVGLLGRLCLGGGRLISAAERSYIRVGLGNQWKIAVTP